MLEPKDKPIVSFRALRVPTLTAEVAARLEAVLNNLPGVEKFTVDLESQELCITFDKTQLDFQTLAQAMTGAGCSLRNIDAAVFLS
jgi:copper chaperone CopZ